RQLTLMTCSPHTGFIELATMNDTISGDAIIEPSKSSDFKMFLLFLLLIGFQLITIQWKNRSPKTYNTVTLVGLWTIPLIISITNGFTRFVFIWMSYFVGTCIVLKPALRKPIDPMTPSVYHHLYTVTYAIGSFAYVIFLIEFFGFPGLLSTQIGMSVFELSILLLFYSLYFGLLGRDTINEVSGRMARVIGFYNEDGIPTRHLRDHICAICGGDLSEGAKDDEGQPLIHSLSCNHKFHDSCIRGWCIVGKKDMCPYCREKVDLKTLVKENPWETQQLWYLNLLDALRYTLVWQPVVFFIFHYALK
ncbi:hypothetical protein ROZALSC1DRAFT_31472, partial [Rozella allomycis CSF55]